MWLTCGSCCGIHSELSWPLSSWTRSAPSTSSTRGFFFFMSLKFEANSDSKSLWWKQRKGSSCKCQKFRRTCRLFDGQLKMFLPVRMGKRRFLLSVFHLPQPLNQAAQQVFHGACWLVGSCRVGDDMTGEIFPRVDSSPEAVCKSGLCRDKLIWTLYTMQIIYTQ